MDLYAESILDHAHHPLCKGPMKHPTVSHEETNASCGDSLELRLLIKGKRINDIRWEGEAVVERLRAVVAGAEANAFPSQDFREVVGVDLL